MANILHIDRDANKITLGTTGTTINIASHTASKTLALDGSKNLESIQDLRTSASPTFAGLTIVNAITEFSTDGTMGGDSDSAVPTEKATKLYTDTLRSDLASTANAKGASLIGIEDAMSLYTATDVESALEEVKDAITVVTTTANSITTVTGTLDSGNVASTQTINDADTYDVSEVTGTPGFDIQATMTGIVSGHEPNLIEGHYSYNGNHTIRIEMWNYTGTPAWDLISDTIIENTNGAYHFFSLAITGTITDYCSGGEAKVRFNHAVAGNITHDFSIDYLAVKDDHGIGTGITDHGSMSGLSEDDHHQYIKDVEFTQDSGILVGTGAGTFVEETGATLRTSIGLGTGDNPTFAGLFISGQNRVEFQSANNYIYGYSISQLHLISTGEIHLIAGGAYSLKVIHDLGCLFNAGIYITEQASAGGSSATYGQLWTKSGTPNTLWFTDDTGGDFQLGLTGDAALVDLVDVGVVPGDSRFLVGTGAGTLAWETAATAATSMGLGTGDSPTFTKLTLSGASPNVLSVTATGNTNPVATITGGSNTVLVLANTGGPASYLAFSNSVESGNFMGSVDTAMVFWTETILRATINSTGLTLTGNLIIPDGGTIGQSAGPLLTFDDSNNFLEITGCKVGINTATPSERLTVETGHVLLSKGYRIEWGNIDAGIRFTNETPAAFRITESGNDRLAIKNGKVGIGLTVAKTLLTVEGTITLKEQAAADGDTAAYGQIWIDNSNPCRLRFTNDVGGDFYAVVSDADTGGTDSAGAGKQYVEMEIAGIVYKVLHDGTV